MIRRRWLPPFRMLFLLACGLAALDPLPAANIPLQTIRELQAKASAEPFASAPVRTGGIVTWIDASEGNYFQLQDATGGVQVNFTTAEGPQVGDMVEVTGVLDRGPYAPVIDRASFVPKGRGALPAAKNASGGGLLNGEYNGELVDVHGFVRSAERVTPTIFSALLSSGSARITVRVSNAPDLDPQKLIAAKVWMRGVAVPVRARGGIRQLVDLQVLASSQGDFNVFEYEEADPWKGPVRPLAETFQYRPGFSRGDRIRVRGEVVYQRDGVAYLNDGRSGIAVRGAEAGNLKRGDEVEAVGFTDLENFLPILSDAVFASFPPEGARVAPKPLPAESLLDGLQHAAYVRVRGRLMDRLQASAAGGQRILVLALNTPQGIFTAELEGQGTAMPNLEEGCILDVSGICLVSVDGLGNPTSFKVLVPGVDQVSVVEAASFFTVKRLLVLLSLLLGALAAVTLFAYFTMRRNLRLAGAMRERTAVTAERSRLARDLHDTLEQGLTGIHLQLHSIGPAESDASVETRERLQRVHSLVNQCHAEMRQSIWNLRSGALEQFDLAEALERAARSLTLGSDIRVVTRQSRLPGRLPPLLEDNLLRIGQEAITNAVKHASPSVITLELQVDATRAILSVSDDGAGICDEATATPGHFGLTGMHERARRIGGVLRVSANPGGGTTVKVDAPLSAGHF